MSAVWKFVTFRAARLYNTFYYAQYSQKFALVLLFPALLSATRFRAETKYGYNIYITDEELYPGDDRPWWLPFGAIHSLYKWKNGSKVYFRDDASVNDLKDVIYSRRHRTTSDGELSTVLDAGASLDSDISRGKGTMPPKEKVAHSKLRISGTDWASIAVGCKGRMFRADDNLALAVRAFCKRDPRLLVWKEDV